MPIVRGRPPSPAAWYAATSGDVHLGAAAQRRVGAPWRAVRDEAGTDWVVRVGTSRWASGRVLGRGPDDDERLVAAMEAAAAPSGAPSGGLLRA